MSYIPKLTHLAILIVRDIVMTIDRQAHKKRSSTSTTSMAGPAAKDVKESRSAGVSSTLRDVAKVLESNYRQNTPTRLRLLDTFLVFLFVTGVLQVWPDTRFLPLSI